MTATENQAITMLSGTVQLFIEENREAHAELRDALKGIAAHCEERRILVDAQFAKEAVNTAAGIAAANVVTLAAATKPSVYRLAAKGATEGLFRFASRAVIVVALISGLAVLLDKLHLI